MTARPIYLKVFLSSPGDVPTERDNAETVIHDLKYDPMVGDSLKQPRCVAWDRGGGAPMYADMTPQECIDLGMEKPSQCDIVIVILWSRMGTPLDKYKPNGERFLSGTEWEFYDAIHASPFPDKPYKPFVLLYRCIEKIELDPRDKDLEDKLDQLQKVQRFFATFRTESGVFKGSFTEYTTPDQFQQRLESDLRTVINRILSY